MSLKGRTETFIAAYLEAIDFTQLGDMDQPPHGAELTVDSMREAVTDAATFFSGNWFMWTADRDEQAGHDFWFTRNGHGVGFWDRPEIYGDEGAAALTDEAEKYGEADMTFIEEPRERLEDWVR